MERAKYKELFSNVFYLYLVQGLNYILPLICLPYLLTTLNPEAFGIFAFGQASIQFIILFTDFGFNLPISKKIALLAQDKAAVLAIYKRILCLKLILFIVALCFFIPVIFLFSSFEPYRNAVFISLISVVGTVIFPLWLFQGLNKLKIYSGINVISRFMTLPLIFFLVKSGDDYLTPSLLYSLALFIAGVISVIYLYITGFYKGFLQIPLSLKEMKLELKDSGSIFLSNSAISLYTNGLTIVLGMFSTTYMVGLFGALDRFIRMICFSVFVPINQASFPVIAKLGADDPIGARKFLKNITYLIILLLTGILVFYFLLEHIVLAKFFKDYSEAKIYLRIGILTIFPIGLGGVLGQLGLIGLGGKKEKKMFSSVYMTVGFVFFPLSTLLIRFYELRGAVFSMVFAEVLIFAGMFVLCKKYKLI